MYLKSILQVLNLELGQCGFLKEMRILFNKNDLKLRRTLILNYSFQVWRNAG